MKIARPNRKRHSYRQRLVAPPEDVFPLLCPVRELEWVRGWNPRLVLSDSGVAEPDCIFVMPGEPEDTIWIVTLHDPESHRVEMILVTPNRTVGKLEVALARDGNGGTVADVAYTHTSLGDAGDRFLDEFTADRYRGFMETWETELNHYLATGTKLAE